MRHIVFVASLLLALFCGAIMTGCNGNNTLSSLLTGQLPTISSFSPASGAVGTAVTITGATFTGTTAVKFNGTVATSFTVVSATSVTATVPTGATTGKITVTTPGGTATSATDFTVTTGGTSTPAPTITSFTPTSGAVGTAVTITGTNVTGATAVTFNNTTAMPFTVDSATSITATVPSGATTGKIAMTTAGGTATSATDFTVTTSSGGVAGTPGTNPTDGAGMVWVSGGSFTMGTPYGAGWDPPYTQQVTLSGYWVYKYEVTVAQYRAFCTATGRALPSFPSGYSWAGKSGWPDAALQQHPIVNVRWFDAKAYADWAGVSLPTEAQWEYAARGPSGRNYPWGGTATAANPNHGWDQTKCANFYNSDSQGISTWAVGSFPAGVSWCGAHDLAGNVLEWCADWLGDYSTTPVTNPTGPATGTVRVLRGGSWNIDIGYYYYGESYCRGAYRGFGLPDSWDGVGIGFRCVSSSPGP